MVLPFTSEAPTESELRLAQAQLVGWLEGLFHGIQATLFTQQAAGAGTARRDAPPPAAIGDGPGTAADAPTSGYLYPMSTAELFANRLVARRVARVAPRAAARLARRRALEPRRPTSCAACRRWCSPARRGPCTERSAAVAEGDGFLLQAGDCAESLRRRSPPTTSATSCKVILQMAVVLTYGSGVPMVKVGRIAGQFAKPRSSPTERVDDLELPSFRGHIVNDDAFDAAARRPDPHACVRGLPPVGVDAEPAPRLHQGRVRRPLPGARLEPGVRRDEPRRPALRGSSPARSTAPCASCAPAASTSTTSSPLHQVDFYTATRRCSSATRRRSPATTRSPATGTTARPTCSGSASAPASSTGRTSSSSPGCRTRSASSSARRRRPTRSSRSASASTRAVPGRLTLITPHGRRPGRRRLPPLLRAVADAGHPVVWACDPMHGNTFVSESGCKTRRFDDVHERDRAVLRRLPGRRRGRAASTSSSPATTSPSASAARRVLDEQLEHRYTTRVRPRLNARQAIDLAFRVAELLRR